MFFVYSDFILKLFVKHEGDISQFIQEEIQINDVAVF